VGLFTAIGTEAKTIEAIAKETGASPKGIRILCDYLTVQGFLKKLEDHYESTAATQMFLDAKSPAYMGGVVEFMASPEMMRSFLEDPTSYVRNGGDPHIRSLATWMHPRFHGRKQQLAATNLPSTRQHRACLRPWRALQWYVVRYRRVGDLKFHRQFTVEIRWQGIVGALEIVGQLAGLPSVGSRFAKSQLP
jgi:hypothetical protein